MPSRNLRHEALNLGFKPVELEGGEFQLTAFFKPGDSNQGTLHVYLEGDGSPWISRTIVSGDPTTRNPIMLRLMALDRAPALYLGRPCYNGHATDKGCDPLLWTHHRYSPEIIASMVSALQKFRRVQLYHHLRFFGHSGGGALALLLANCLPDTKSVTTLGGNLDIDLWTRYHRYSALTGSLNPASSKTFAYDEFHYFGTEDEQTPPSLFQATVSRRPRARMTLVKGYGHTCCWDDMWARILSETRDTLGRQPD